MYIWEQGVVDEWRDGCWRERRREGKGMGGHLDLAKNGGMNRVIGGRLNESMGE